MFYMYDQNFHFEDGKRIISGYFTMEYTKNYSTENHSWYSLIDPDISA